MHNRSDSGRSSVPLKQKADLPDFVVTVSVLELVNPGKQDGIIKNVSEKSNFNCPLASDSI